MINIENEKDATNINTNPTEVYKNLTSNFSNADAGSIKNSILLSGVFNSLKEFVMMTTAYKNANPVKSVGWPRVRGLGR